MKTVKVEASKYWSIITNINEALLSGKYIGEILIRPKFLHNSIHLILTGNTVLPVRLIYVGEPTTEIRKMFGIRLAGKFDRHQRRTLQ